MHDSEKLTVLVNPKFSEAKELLEKAFYKRRTIVVAGNCKVLYNGRAKSNLELGERLLIIKEDGSLLVHRPVGYEPVNWQPAGSVFHVSVKEKYLEVNGVRQKPRESVRVSFYSLLSVSTFNLVDAGNFLLHATEEEMHRAILLKPDLLEEGFKPISWEKKVDPGFIDIYGEDRDGRLVVVEVKRKVAGKEAALQLAKYIEPIKSKINRELRGILVAPSVGKDVQRLLSSLGLEFKALDPKVCSEILNQAEDTKLESFFNE